MRRACLLNPKLPHAFVKLHLAERSIVRRLRLLLEPAHRIGEEAAVLTL